MMNAKKAWALRSTVSKAVPSYFFFAGEKKRSKRDRMKKKKHAAKKKGQMRCVK